MLLGLCLGGCAAICLAFSYIFSGYAVRHNLDVGPIGLLARAHLLMGVLSLCGLPFVWCSEIVSGFGTYWRPLFGGVVFYLVGQGGLFMAQRKVDASRVVPLLGLKLLVLATLNAFVLRIASYGWLQWFAVAMTIASALILNNAGRRIPLGAFGWIVLACVGYSLSDICITNLTHSFQGLGVPGLMRPSLVSTFLSYILSAVFGMIAMPFVERRPLSVWKSVTPYACFWLVAMMFLFACFTLIGTVNGNIVQSTRGILAIALGAAMAKAGFTELEEKVGPTILARRYAAAVLMLLSIVCFNWEQLRGG